MSMQEVLVELDNAKDVLGHVPGNEVGADLILLALIGKGIADHVLKAKEGLDTAKEHMPDYYGHAKTAATRSTEASGHLFSAMLGIGGNVDDVNPHLAAANAYTVEVTQDTEAMVVGYQTMEDQLDKALVHLQGLGEAVMSFLQAQSGVEAARKDAEGHSGAAVQKIDEYTQPLR